MKTCWQRWYTSVHLVCVAIVMLMAALLGGLLPLHYVCATGNVSITRQFSPSDNAPVTSNAGDNNGFETTPSNAYGDDGNYAEDADSGLDDNADPVGIGTDKHDYYNYGMGGIPQGSTIHGITVRADIAVDSTLNSPFTAIRLSWDGGNSWTAVKQQTLTAPAETPYTYGGTADDWGHTPWSASELSDTNFRVQVINGDTKLQNSLRDFSLDWVPVSITFTAPWESYKTSDRTEVWGDDVPTAYNSDYHIAYMKGTGFATGFYHVAYYDVTGDWVANDENKEVTTDILNSACDLTTDPLALGDNYWHALVQPATCPNAFPSTADGYASAYDRAVANPNTYELLANDSFYVAQSAIPEFPIVIAGIVVAGLCFGIYYWMRKRKLAHVKT